MSLFIILQTAMGTPALIGLLSVVSFLLVFGIRKVFGRQWERVANLIPAINFDLTPGWTILSKLVQALPATLIAATIGAATSGVSLGPTLVAATAGLLSVSGHEFAKWLPLIPYRGDTANVLSGGPKIPGLPGVSTGLVVGAICLALVSCSAGRLAEPCSAADKAAIVSKYAAIELQECGDYDSLNSCPFFDDIKADRAKEDAKCR